MSAYLSSFSLYKRGMCAGIKAYAFLDGLIEKEIYLAKKEKFIKRKLELNERKAGFARAGLI